MRGREIKIETRDRVAPLRHRLERHGEEESSFEADAQRVLFGPPPPRLSGMHKLLTTYLPHRAVSFPGRASPCVIVNDYNELNIWHVIRSFYRI